MSLIEELRERTLAANLRLVSERLVRLTWGNVSARDGDLVAIKPSGVSYERLCADDVVVLDLDGVIQAGELRPSTDTETHLALYRAFPEIGGVVHAHSTFATSFAQARRPIPCLGTTHADVFAGEVPLARPLTDAEVSSDYEANTGRLIVNRFVADQLDPLQVPGVLLAGHGPFTWGRTEQGAVDTAVALEALAEIALLTERAAGGPPVLLEEHVRRTHFERKHGADAYYGQR